MQQQPSERQQQAQGGDRVKENRKSLSAKTQKLIETTSAISTTLSQMERKSNGKRGVTNDLFKQLSSSILLEESLSVPSTAAAGIVPDIATTTGAVASTPSGRVVDSAPVLSTKAQLKPEPLKEGLATDIHNFSASSITKSHVADDVNVEYQSATSPFHAPNIPSRESVSLVEKIIEIEAPNLSSKDLPVADKEETITSQEIKKKNTGVTFTTTSSTKKEKSSSLESLEEEPFPSNVARRISIKKIEAISTKEKAPELELSRRRKSKDESLERNVASAEILKPEISTQTSLIKVDTKETDATHGVEPVTIEGKKSTLEINKSASIPVGTDLFQKIAELESKLKESSELHLQSQLAHSTLTSKFESAKHHNQDLQMRNSRLDMEMKSLLEQNETLRNEHRRMSELESSLRLRVIELSQPKPQEKKSPLDASDLISQERILQQLDEQIGWISAHQQEANENSFAAKHLRFFEDAFEVLKKSVTEVSESNPKSSLNICRTISNIAIQSLKVSWDSNKVAHTLDLKLQALQQDAKHAEKEAYEKLRKLKESHDETVSNLTTSQKQFSKQFDGLLEKYKIVKEENEELRAANEELYADNQALLGIVQKPEEPKEVVLLSDPNSKASVEHIDSLSKANHELRLHIAQLNRTVESWKEENQSIQSEFAKIVQEKSSQESENLKLTEKLSLLKNEVEEERLTSQKAAELIKSLQTELEGSKILMQSRDSEKLLAAQMASLQSSSIADSGVKDESLYEAQILSFVKGTREKVKHIQELEAQIKECNFTIAHLEEENGKLKNKSAQTKDKFQVREVAWLERLKKSKEDLEALNLKCQSFKDNLRSYQEQYTSIKSLEGVINFSNVTQDSHPYPFAQIFNNLFHKSSLSSLKCQELEKNLLDTKHAYEDTSKDLLVQMKQFETLGSESKSTRNQLVEISGVKATLESKILQLEENVQHAVAEKERAQQKLKEVVGKMIEFVQLSDPE